jgi:hypothetical protein
MAFFLLTVCLLDCSKVVPDDECRKKALATNRKAQFLPLQLTFFFFMSVIFARRRSVLATVYESSSSAAL